MTKRFKLRPDQIREIAPGYGACVASDKIVVDGMQVGYMYREEAQHEIDSGWRFLSGTESDAYLGNTANLGVYSTNTIANYDPEIITLLTSPEGSAFERSKASGGRLAPVAARAGSPASAIFKRN